MPSAKVGSILLPILFMFLCSCAGGMFLSRSVEIPEQEIAALAAQIEELVLNTAPDQPTISDFQDLGQPGEVLGDIDLMNIVVSSDEIRRKVPALARLNVDNEIVLAAIRGRMLRRVAVREFEQNGCVGENHRGLLQYLGGKWCTESRNTKNRAGYVVFTDNRDRRSIYEQLIEANGLGGSAMGRVREIFAYQIHKKAWAGTPLEMPDGTWKRR